MTTYEIISGSLALVSLLVSIYVAYQTLWTKFKGNIWPVRTIVFAKIDTPQRDRMPSVGLVLYVENTGARVGRMDNLRVRIRNERVESEHTFFATLIRKDYNFLASYLENDWYPFDGIGIFEKGNAKVYYVVFKPSDNGFVPSPGVYKFSLEVRWMGEKTWNVIPGPVLTVTEDNVNTWLSPTGKAFQITVDN